MGFERKKINLVSVWDTVRKHAKRDDDGVWAEFDFQTILEKTEKLHFYSRLIAEVLPPNQALKEKIRLLWGGRNFNVLVLLVQEPLLANQLRYLLTEIERRLAEKTKYVPPIKIEVRPQQWGHFGIHLIDKAPEQAPQMTDAEADAVIKSFLNQ